MVLAPASVFEPVPPDAIGIGALNPDTVPPVIATALEFCKLILPRLPVVACTNAVEAICVELVPRAAVGALGVPENIGLLETNAVEAIWVVAVPAAAVGAAGIPVNTGLIF